MWHDTAQPVQIPLTIPAPWLERSELHPFALHRSLLTPVVVVLLWAGLLSVSADAADRPFDMSANWGGTGLMEIPSARILPDGTMRLGVAKASPYLWYTFGFGILPGLEFTGRYTDVTNISGGLGAEFGSFKDKAFDIKYQLLPETKKHPAVALGWNDFEGTRQFESQYLTLSRQLYPLDITLGMGRQRFKGPLSICDDIGFWGGLEWALTDRLHMMLEYNPIEYPKDSIYARGVPEGSDLPLNLGIRYRTWFGFDCGLTYQRGDTLAMAVHMQFELGSPILPQKPDPPSWGFAIPSAQATGHNAQQVQRLAQDLEEAGFVNITASSFDGDLVAEIENTRYLSHAKAAGRAMRLLLKHAGDATERLVVVFKRRGMKLLYVSAAARDARRYFMGDMAEAHFINRLMVIPYDPSRYRGAPTPAAVSAAVQHQRAQRGVGYGIDPILESFFNDPSSVYQSRLSLRPHGTLDLWPGGALHGSYEMPLYSDVESSVDTPPDAVRSDAWKYLGSQSDVNRLLFDQILPLGALSHARFSAGYLERMYAGAGGEVLGYPGKGRWAVGVEGDWVKKRDPDAPWTLLEQSNHTLLGNLYYHYLPLDITLKTQVGRFLAGDTGARMAFNRRFHTGAQLSFWYSLTDTGDLTGFNRGYSDKGISLSLPFATFTNRPTRRMLCYRISPWTRDTGATVDHWQEVYNVTADLVPFYFNRDLNRFDE
jgi:hypothetical protein